MVEKLVDDSKYKEEKILEKYSKHDTDRQMCSICGETIPSNIKRLSIPYKNKFGQSWIRICERCIYVLNKKKNLKNIKKWEHELMQKEFVKGI